MLNRYPGLKFVSVESGIGWLPFMLEATDYSWLGAFRPGRERKPEDVLPSELFRQGVYVTYWFESVAPQHFIDVIPIDNVLFETDFPHTTCLFGNIQETIASGLGHVDASVRAQDPLGERGRPLPHRGAVGVVAECGRSRARRRRVGGDVAVTGPLDGVRVVEVASHVFVPMAGAVLNEWGADVIKIEHPETGDPYRGLVTAGIGRTGGGSTPASTRRTAASGRSAST